jgi:hypothetical protein
MCQAESPDEEALVSAARDLEWEFTGRTPTEEFVRVPTSEGPVSYRLLALIPFSSTRKRMSIVVRGPDGRVVVLTKGADNVIFERYAHTQRHTQSTHTPKTHTKDIHAARRLTRRSKAVGTGMAGACTRGKLIMTPFCYPRVSRLWIVSCTGFVWAGRGRFWIAAVRTWTSTCRSLRPMG